MDAGDTDAGEVEGCGSVNEFGKCRGNDAVWCSDGELVELPCNDALDTGIAGTCTVAPSFGSWCSVAQGKQCAFELPGEESLALFVCGSSGSGLACDLDDGCVAGGGACVPPPSGQPFATSCMGSRLVIGCSAWGQKVTQSCLGSEIGGTGCSAGACAGIPAGRTCDGVRKCATGLTCTNNVCGKAAAPAWLSVSVSGGGRVVSTPAAIDCPGWCGAAVDEGVEVTLTATADEGWRFESWSGGCEGTSPTVSVTMSGTKTCTATFVRSLYYLNVYVSSGGRVTSEPSGIDCPGTCAAGYEPDTEVTLTAEAPDGYRLTKWQGCSTATTESITVTLDSDLSCSPVFEQVAEVSVTVTGPGRVTSAPAGLDCPETCSALFVPNRSISLTAAPEPESRFVGWSGRCSGTGLTASFYAYASGGNACTATFEAIPRYELTVSIVGDGEVASAPGVIECPGACTDEFADQTTVTLGAVASPGSRFARWRDLSVPAWTDCKGTAPTTTVKLGSARHCRAEFVKDLTATLAWRHAAPGQSSSEVAWRPDGGAVAFFGGSSVQLFDATTGAFQGSFVESNPHAVAWSPDGVTVAAAVSSGSNQRVALRDVTSGAVRYLPATGYVTTGSITSLAWSPDGQRLATAESTGAVKIWNAATGLPVMNWNPSTSGVGVSGLAWSPDGNYLATTFNSSGEGMSLWSTADWSRVEVFFPAPSSSEVAWSADSSFVVGATYSAIFIWSVDGDTRSFDANSCTGASVDPAGTRLVARCQGQATVWDLSEGASIFTASLPNGATAFDLSWSPTAGVIAVGSYDGRAWLVDADTREVTRSFGGAWGSVTELALHPARNELFGVSYDGVVYALDASTGADARNLTATKFDQYTRPNSLTFSPDGDVLAVGAGSYVYTWKTADGAEHAPRWYAGSTVIQLRWSLADVLATSLSGDKGIKLWPSGVEPASATLQRSSPAYQSSPEIAWHPGGRYLASAGRNDTQLWDRTTNLPTVTLPCPVVGTTAGVAESTAFTSDGARLASTCSNGLQVWDWAESAEASRVPLTGATRLAWRPGDEALAVVVNGKVQLFEATTGNALLAQPLTTEGSATDLTWSVDGATLFVGTSNGRIEAYDIAR